MSKLGVLVSSAPIPEPVRERVFATFDCIEPDRALRTDEVIEIANGRGASALLAFLGMPLRAEHIARLPETVRVVATISVRSLRQTQQI